jgi:hypothetical protein
MMTRGKGAVTSRKRDKRFDIEDSGRFDRHEMTVKSIQSLNEKTRQKSMSKAKVA